MRRGVRNTVFGGLGPALWRVGSCPLVAGSAGLLLDANMHAHEGFPRRFFVVAGRFLRATCIAGVGFMGCAGLRWAGPGWVGMGWAGLVWLRGLPGALSESQSQCSCGISWAGGCLRGSLRRRSGQARGGGSEAVPPLMAQKSGLEGVKSATFVTGCGGVSGTLFLEGWVMPSGCRVGEPSSGC